MRSSYKENNYGELFKALVIIYNPRVIVECGILDGYSLLHMAEASSADSQIFAYDLFEDYEFKHGKKEEIQNTLDANFCGNVKLIKQDAIEAAENHQDNSVGFLHIDISNDYDNLRKMFKAWHSKIKIDGLVVFEGGSEERDKVDWMVKYEKTLITDFKFDFLKESPYFEFITLTPFPSLTICRKIR